MTHTTSQATSEDLWEQNKRCIIQLWIGERYSMKKLIKVMEEECGFIATKSQYNRQFRAWGLKKNLKKQDAKHIQQELQRRKDANKDTSVKLHGVPLEEKNLNRRLSRHQMNMTTFEIARERWKQEQDRKSGPSNDLVPELKGYDLGTPSAIESDDNSLTQPLGPSDATETNFPDTSAAPLPEGVEANGGSSPDDNSSQCHPYNCAGSFERPQDSETAKGLEQLIAALFQGLDLAADEKEGSDLWADELPQEMPIWFNACSKPYPDQEDIPYDWDSYAAKKKKCLEEYIQSRKSEAAAVIDCVKHLASLNLAGEPDEAAVKEAWVAMERDFDFEILPYHICRQILKSQLNEEFEMGEIDNLWCESMRTYLENDFSKMQFAAINTHPVKETYEVPTQSPQDDNGFKCSEFDTFESVAIHLPTFISKFGLHHFFTAFALQEVARYLCFSQTTELPTLTPIQPGNHEPSPVQKYPAIAKMLTEALLIYDKIGMADHPFAIDCLDMLLGSIGPYDPQNRLCESLERIAHIPYENYTRCSDKYGLDHQRTIAALAQVISFSLDLLSCDSYAQLAISQGWTEDSSVEAIFDQRFDSFLSHKPINGGGDATTRYIGIPHVSNNRPRWDDIVRVSMFDIVDTLERLGRLKDALRLLERMKKWENTQYDSCADDLFQIDLAFGRIRGKLGDYRLSLQALSDAVEKAKSLKNRKWELDAIHEIAIVAMKTEAGFCELVRPLLPPHLEHWINSVVTGY
ncbi:hypothetical protein TWF718_007444 [Orbilia javanica]|uniref:Clr5 domain-containing protein n=1 Tax=Orbilia javanica TaxID=47235 RepID=A0AAN8NW60_9PEZI